MNTGRPTVVVVDDSATVRAFFERIAAVMNVHIECFEAAADALPYLERTRPDLVFLDIIMPDKDGLTFLQELRRDPRHHATRFVMISSKDYAQDRATARELGALDFVPKPVTTQKIRELIARHTGVLAPGAGAGDG
jgi:DNA-binding response OmpR family regulator